MLFLLLLSCWCFQGSSQDPATSIAAQDFTTARKEPGNCSSTEDCPDGLFCYEHHCNCLPSNKIVRCGEGYSDSSVLVLNGYCVTYDKQDSRLLIGTCLFWSKMESLSRYYTPLYEVQLGKLNETCQEWKRTGVLCGKCLPDHYPLAYSYNLTCVPCSYAHGNWLWYIMAAYLPLTLFYFFILFFKVKIMSGHAYMAVSVCQVLSSPILVRQVIPYLTNATESYLVDIMVSLYGIWNLDFFRSSYSNLSLCLGILPTLALDYVVAVYPLFLIIVSYLLITLYDRNYRVVTAMWSPFRRLFSLFRRNWDIKTSVIDSFATFFFISNIKFTNVSYNLLAPTTVYYSNGHRKNHTLGLLYSADIDFFGKEHLPYAVLALTVFVLFVLVPTILLTLYPFRFFQRFLNLFPLRWYILHTFMDSFLGCYKDGTQPGTRDCRCFLGFFLFVRVLIFLLSSLHVSAYPWTVHILVLLLVVVMAVKPLKNPISNLTSTAYILLLAFTFSIFDVIQFSASYNGFLNTYTFLIIFAVSVPLVDAARVVLMLVVRRRHCIFHSVASFYRRHDSSNYEELPGGCSEGEERMSDRILDPENYTRRNLSSLAAN